MIDHDEVIARLRAYGQQQRLACLDCGREVVGGVVVCGPPATEDTDPEPVGMLCGPCADARTRGPSTDAYHWSPTHR